jgi:hypothetical protein
MGEAVRESHLGDLKPDKRNARRHNARNVGMVERSLETDGFGRSILLDAAGNIIAGNGVTEAAGNVGIEDVLIVPSDGTRVIAIQRTDVEPGSERAVRLAIADNRANELSDFDPAVVAALANEVDLSDFWRDDELNVLLASVSDAPPFDPQSEWTGMPEFHQDDLMPEHRVIVNFATAEALEEFAALVKQPLPRGVKNVGSIWFPRQERRELAHLGYVSDEPDTP